MAEAIVDGAGSGFYARVNADGRLLVDLGGDVTISGVNIDSITIQETAPTDDTKNNPMWSFEYDADGNLGSVYQMYGTGSYVNVITWIGFSGTLPGTGSRVTNVGSWSAV